MNRILNNFVLAGLAASLAWNANAVANDLDLEAAILPGTDLVVRADIHGVLTSPFGEKFLKAVPEQDELFGELGFYQQEKFCQRFGVSKYALGKVVFSADFDPPKKEQKEAWDGVFVIGIESTTQWDLKKIAEAVAEPEKEAPRQVAVPQDYDGLRGLKIGPAADEKEKQPPRQHSDEIYLVVSADGTVLLVSQFEPELRAAARMKSQQPVALDPKLQALCAAAQPGSQVFGGFLLTSEMKQELHKLLLPESEPVAAGEEKGKAEAGKAKPVAEAEKEKAEAEKAKAEAEAQDPWFDMRHGFASLQQLGWSLKLDQNAALQLRAGLPAATAADKANVGLKKALAFLRGMAAANQGDPEETALVNGLFDNIKVASAEQDVVLDILFASTWVSQVQAKKEKDKKAAAEAQAQENRKVVAPPLEE